MLRHVVNRDFRDLAELAVEQGWTVEVTRGNHLRWRSPSGFSYFSAVTPSDHRAVRNLRSALRRAGLVLANHV